MKGLRLPILALLLLLLTVSTAWADGYRDLVLAQDAPDADEKIRLLTKAIDSGDLKDRKLAEAYESRGWTWAEKEDFNQALADFAKAREAAPKLPDPYYALGWAYHKLEDLDRAIEYLNQAIELSPKHPYAYCERAWVWDDQGDTAKALADFNQAILINPADLEALLGRSSVLEERGRVEEAYQDLKRVMDLDPEYEDAAEQFKRVGEILEARGALPAAASTTAAPTTPTTPAPAETTTPSVIPLPTSEKRFALVIGNSEYLKFPTLRNPANDAADMARALKQTGFEVDVILNATRDEMLNAVREFGEKIKGGGVGLFYFAGHGVQVKGENYLVPVDAAMEFEDEVEDGAVKASAVLRKMETAGNRLNIVILDACRNNPLPSAGRSADRGLARMDAPRGSLLVYATAPGSTASDGEGRNGLFTSKLITHLMTPGQSIESLLKRVRVDVMEASGERQVPWNASSLTGEFYFVEPSAQ